MAVQTGNGQGRWMSTGQAGEALGVSSETIRRWVDSGLLDGVTETRVQRRRYLVSRRSVERMLVERTRDQDGSVLKELQTLRGRVSALEAAAAAAAAGEVARERDMYRAENTALKEALLRLNGAMEHMERAASEQAEALREQRDALSVLLTPDSLHG